jgi:hypothetical protein
MVAEMVATGHAILLLCATNLCLMLEACTTSIFSSQNSTFKTMFEESNIQNL